MVYGNIILVKIDIPGYFYLSVYMVPNIYTCNQNFAIKRSNVNKFWFTMWTNSAQQFSAVENLHSKNQFKQLIIFTNECK